jgi:hypothetical protein
MVNTNSLYIFLMFKLIKLIIKYLQFLVLSTLELLMRLVFFFLSIFGLYTVSKLTLIHCLYVYIYIQIERSILYRYTFSLKEYGRFTFSPICSIINDTLYLPVGLYLLVFASILNVALLYIYFCIWFH